MLPRDDRPRIEPLPVVRRVDMLPSLRDERLSLKAAARKAEPNGRVFPTTTGHRHGPSNIRRRVLAPAVKRANERLTEVGPFRTGPAAPKARGRDPVRARNVPIDDGRSALA